MIDLSYCEKEISFIHDMDTLWYLVVQTPLAVNRIECGCTPIIYEDDKGSEVERCCPEGRCRRCLRRLSLRLLDKDRRRTS